jgi:hypothetical protein
LTILDCPFGLRITRLVPLVEQELVAFPENLSLHRIVSLL